MRPFHSILVMIFSVLLTGVGVGLWTRAATMEHGVLLTTFAVSSAIVFALLVYVLRAFLFPACPPVASRAGPVPDAAKGGATQDESCSQEIVTLEPDFWKFAMDSVAAYVYAKDLRGRYLGQNRSLLVQFGHSSEEEVIGKSNYDLYAGILDKEMLDQLEENDLRAAYSDVPIVAEEVVPKENGESMVCESIKSSYRSPSGEVLGMICVSRDITSRKQVELELLKSRAEAQAASKAKSAFLANTSHEIRTPLNGIIGMLYLTLQTELTPQQRDYLQKGDAAAKYLLSVLNDILDFSKMEAGKLQLECVPINVRDIFTQEVDLQRTVHEGKGVIIALELAPEVPERLLGDSLRIRQVLANLLSNAVKFTVEGTVRVRCAVDAQENDLVRLRVSVADTGVGMTQEQVARIFSAFQQGDVSTTRKFGGTGLGLAICRQLVTLMDGEFFVHSEMGKGSTFTFTLALALSHEDVGAATETEHVITRGSLRGRRILVAEDNAINRLIASEILQQMGVVVEEAHDGVEAIEKIHDNEYDVVLMDIQMPRMDGLTATRILRQVPHLRALPIIAMTAHAMTTDVEESLAAGMQAHVTKPIDPAVLRAALLRCLE